MLDSILDSILLKTAQMSSRKIKDKHLLTNYYVQDTFFDVCI